MQDKSASETLKPSGNTAAERYRTECIAKVLAEPEYLVVNCWRSVRELALILGGRLSHCGLTLASPGAGGDEGYWLNFDQVLFCASPVNLYGTLKKLDKRFSVHYLPFIRA